MSIRKLIRNCVPGARDDRARGGAAFVHSASDEEFAAIEDAPPHPAPRQLPPQSARPAGRRTGARLGTCDRMVDALGNDIVSGRWTASNTLRVRLIKLEHSVIRPRLIPGHEENICASSPRCAARRRRGNRLLQAHILSARDRVLTAPLDRRPSAPVFAQSRPDPRRTALHPDIHGLWPAIPDRSPPRAPSTPRAIALRPAHAGRRLQQRHPVRHHRRGPRLQRQRAHGPARRDAGRRARSRQLVITTSACALPIAALGRHATSAAAAGRCSCRRSTSAIRATPA